jgi:hypothetical protein
MPRWPRHLGWYLSLRPASEAPASHRRRVGSILAWSIDALQSGREADASKFITFFREAIVKKMGEGSFIFKWMLETLLDHRGRHRTLDCSKFETMALCVNTLRVIEDNEDGLRLNNQSVLDLIHRIGHRQFE